MASAPVTQPHEVPWASRPPWDGPRGHWAPSAGNTARGRMSPGRRQEAPPHNPPLSRTAKPATDLLALSMSSSSSHGAPSGLRRGLLERACREQTTVSDSFLRLEAAGAGRANGPRALGTPRTEDGGSRGAGRVWGRAPWSSGLPLPVSGRPALRSI